MYGGNLPKDVELLVLHRFVYEELDGIVTRALVLRAVCKRWNAFIDDDRQFWWQHVGKERFPKHGTLHYLKTACLKYAEKEYNAHCKHVLRNAYAQCSVTIRSQLAIRRWEAKIVVHKETQSKRLAEAMQDMETYEAKLDPTTVKRLRRNRKLTIE
jgi:hypothetical protein